MKKWIYETNINNTARFVLGEIDDDIDSGTFICFGINPSTAKPDALDPTLKRVKKFAELNECKSWIMLNIYPQRCTDPNELGQVIDDRLCQDNLSFIDSILEQYKTNCKIVFAYGNLINKRPYLQNCLQCILVKLEERYTIYDFGKTKLNNPKHPLYLKSEAKLVIY